MLESGHAFGLRHLHHACGQVLLSAQLFALLGEICSFLLVLLDVLGHLAVVFMIWRRLLLLSSRFTFLTREDNDLGIDWSLIADRRAATLPSIEPFHVLNTHPASGGRWLIICTGTILHTSRSVCLAKCNMHRLLRLSGTIRTLLVLLLWHEVVIQDRHGVLLSTVGCRGRCSWRHASSHFRSGWSARLHFRFNILKLPHHKSISYR